jgi:membrane-associated phospholipid phosphatase
MQTGTRQRSGHSRLCDHFPVPAPLIALRLRPAAIGAVVAAAAVTAWLAVMSYHAGSTAFDTWALRTSSRHLGPGWARVLIHLSDPWLTFAVLVVVGVAAALARRWDLLALTVVGPGAAVLVTEYVLKPIIGRLISVNIFFGDYTNAYVGSFPSGHETGVIAAALVVLFAAGSLPLRPAARLTTVAVLVIWVVLAAVGLVRNLYHYATDTIGGAGVSVVIVLGAALALDRWYPPARERLARRQLARRG